MSLKTYKLKNEYCACSIFFQSLHEINIATGKRYYVSSIHLPIKISKPTLNELYIDSIINNYVADLSGIQQQRVATAESFKHKLAIVFADKRIDFGIYLLRKVQKDYIQTAVALVFSNQIASDSNILFSLKNNLTVEVSPLWNLSFPNMVDIYL